MRYSGTITLLITTLLITACSLFDSDRQKVIKGPPPPLPSTELKPDIATTGTIIQAPKDGTSSGAIAVIPPPSTSGPALQPPQAPAAKGLASQALTVAVHESLSMTEAEVRAALAEAGKWLGVELTLQGAVLRFGQGYPAEPNCVEDYRKLTWLPAHVMVVPRIGRCAEGWAGIPGCAVQGGIRIHAVPLGDAIKDGQLWAHLLGHNAGLVDVPESKDTPRLMSPAQPIAGNGKLTPEEQAHVRIKDWNAAAISTPLASVPTPQPKTLTPATTEDMDWLKQVHVHGLPLEELPAHLTPAAVPQLKAWLADAGLSQWWSHAVVALGALGGTEAQDTLRDFIRRGEGEQALMHYRARADALVVLGQMAAVDEANHPALVDYLISYLKGQGEALTWTVKHLPTVPEMREQCRIFAAQGLAASGRPAALAALRSTMEALPDDSPLKRSIKEELAGLEPQ
jgi:hypothetical protein